MNNKVNLTQITKEIHLNILACFFLRIFFFKNGLSSSIKRLQSYLLDFFNFLISLPENDS